MFKVEFVPSGSVTTPRGFRAGATCAGIKKKEAPDLGILASEASCVATGLFTANRIKAAPVVLSQRRIAGGKASGVVVNAGCANACTGEQGLMDAAEMTSLAAEIIGVPAEEVLVASTGVIGQLLPMARIREGMKKVAFTLDGGNDLARAIMTTDTVPKAAAVKMEGADFTIGGICKGSGMIHPSLATFLCFLTTDAAVDKDFLKQALRQAADVSFNMVSVDGDTSTNDTLLFLTNGLAGNEPITKKSRLAEAFQQALNHLCIHLAKLIARDGEGAAHRIEVTVSGAPNVFAARLAARTIVSSSLVKSAVHGADPNWGRIVAALGRSGVEVEEKKIDLYLGNVCLLKDGRPVPFDHDEAVRVLLKDEVPIAVNLNMGIGTATAWGCDLSEEYVTINSAYTT